MNFNQPSRPAYGKRRQSIFPRPAWRLDELAVLFLGGLDLYGPVISGMHAVFLGEMVLIQSERHIQQAIEGDKARLMPFAFFMGGLPYDGLTFTRQLPQRV